MAHFAKLDENNIVIDVIVINNEDCLDDNGIESEEVGINFCKQLFGEDTRWVQTSYNNNFRYNYACIAGYFDEINQAFIAEKIFDSWVLDSNFRWKPPFEAPNDGNIYDWDEATISWVPYNKD